MNIEEVILLKEFDMNIKSIELPTLSTEEQECIKFHIELTRHIQEIEQLFRVFCVNLKNILHFYVLNNNDVITKKIPFDFEEHDNIIINAFIINYISSGKTLKESIETFMEQKLGDSLEKYIDFKENCLKKLYDDFFGYRLLLRMRDFSQHGHLIVNVDNNNKYSFDIEQILLTPHFNLNKKLKEEMKKIKEDIYNRYQDHPRIVFTVSVAEFNFCIIKTYLEFLNTIEDIVKKSVHNINSLLQNRPDIIYKSKDSLNGLVFFDECDGIAHCFDPKEDSLQMFEFIKGKATELLKKEEIELEELKKTFRYE